MSAADLVDKVLVVHGGQTLAVLHPLMLQLFLVRLTHGIQGCKHQQMVSRRLVCTQHSLKPILTHPNLSLSLSLSPHRDMHARTHTHTHTHMNACIHFHKYVNIYTSIYFWSTDQHKEKFLLTPSIPSLCTKTRTGLTSFSVACFLCQSLVFLFL